MIPNGSNLPHPSNEDFKEMTRRIMMLILMLLFESAKAAL
jgi:hypothetical protein